MHARRREVERKEEIDRLIQAAGREVGADFPQSIKEYRMMSASGRKELQMLISRFLIASEASQGLLRTRCRWTRSQTAPLINEYKSDVSNHYFVCFFSRERTDEFTAIVSE